MSNMCAVVECKLLFMSLNAPNSQKYSQGHDLYVVNGSYSPAQRVKFQLDYRLH